VTVPKRNVVPKPDELSFAQAACLSTAWLTAYRMLFVKSGLRPGQSVLVQGASGGVATACISMARAAGYRVYATARTEDKQAKALELGAHQVFASGARLPERVDAVMETVGEATYSHSAKSLKPGGRIVISGATSGPNPPADLNRFFFLQLELVGSTMGTKAELGDLISFLRSTGLRPHIDRTIPLEQIGDGLAAMASGDLVGKIVIEV
jgi:NADPH:quinone reductase-like Zn-dependent oxidoreductase